MNSTGRNILMITARADFGGGPQHLFLLLKYLSHSFNIFIACPDDFPYKKRYELLIGAEKFCIIPHRKFKFMTLLKLMRFIKMKEIKLIHSHGRGAGIYSRLLSLLTGRPVVHTFHGLHIDNYSRFPKLFFFIMEKGLSFFTEIFICVSQSELSRVLAAKITSASKIEVINNGVEINENPVFERLPDQPVKILHITRFDYAKNSLLLIGIIEALKKMGKNSPGFNQGGNKFKFIIIGRGDDESVFKNRIFKENLDDYIEMPGTSENIQSYLREAFCLISTSRWEGMPLSVMEAMASGVPVIATNVPGNRDLVEHNRTGFLFDIKKPEEAAGYLSLLIEHPDLCKKFSAASIEKIKKNFNAGRMAEETGHLYSRIFDR